MSRKILNVALAVMLLSIAYSIVRCDDGERSDGGALTQQQIDSMLTPRRGGGGTVSPAQQPLDDGIEVTVYDTFPFDPNTADTTALMRLGFPRWMVRSILKYRAKGGRYRVREDVKAIYGMTPELYDRIAPYITIDPKYMEYSRAQVEAERMAAHDRMRGRGDSVPTLHQQKLARGEHVDLNTADTAALRTVPGIGAWRARQIIMRRDSLGGYVDVGQLRELAGMPDSCLGWFVVSPEAVRRIDINTATMNEMRRHPYIGFYRARAIVEYRHRHGRITSLDDLLQHPDFTQHDIVRLQAYVKL